MKQKEGHFKDINMAATLSEIFYFFCVSVTASMCRGDLKVPWIWRNLRRLLTGPNQQAELQSLNCCFKNTCMDLFRSPYPLSRVSYSPPPPPPVQLSCILYVGSLDSLTALDRGDDGKWELKTEILKKQQCRCMFLLISTILSTYGVIHMTCCQRRRCRLVNVFMSCQCFCTTFEAEVR